MLRIRIKTKNKKFVEKVLDYITYNKTLSFAVDVIIIFLILLYIASFFIKFIPATFLAVGGNFIAIYVVICLVWEGYRNEQYIAKLEANDWIDNEELLIDLAALSHNIWSEDVGATSNNVNEHDRSLVSYNELTEAEKQVNLAKARKILDVIENYV